MERFTGVGAIDKASGGKRRRNTRKNIPGMAKDAEVPSGFWDFLSWLEGRLPKNVLQRAERNKLSCFWLLKCEDLLLSLVKSIFGGFELLIGQNKLF